MVQAATGDSAENLLPATFGESMCNPKLYGQQVDKLLFVIRQLQLLQQEKRDGGVKLKGLGIPFLPLPKFIREQELVAQVTQRMAQLMAEHFPLALGAVQRIDEDMRVVRIKNDFVGHSRCERHAHTEAGRDVFDGEI